MPNTVIFQKSTKTIRQMPQNYLLANKVGNRWVCDPDTAVDASIATALFNIILLHEYRYGTGEDILAGMTQQAAQLSSV